MSREIQEFASLAEKFRVIGHPARVAILNLLCTCGCSRHTVKSIYESLHLDQPSVSQHLNIMRASVGSLFPKEKWAVFGKLLLLSSVLQLGITAFETIFPLFIKDSGELSVAFIGAGLLICGLVMAVFQPLVAKWGSQVISNPEKQMALGFLIAGLILPVFVFSQTPWTILLAIGIFGLGSSMVVPNLLALVSLRESGSSGWALGMQSSFSGIGQITGRPLSARHFIPSAPPVHFILPEACW